MNTSNYLVLTDTLCRWEQYVCVWQSGIRSFQVAEFFMHIKASSTTAFFSNINMPIPQVFIIIIHLYILCFSLSFDRLGSVIINAVAFKMDVEPWINAEM